jgi:hypothetical protein
VKKNNLFKNLQVFNAAPLPKRLPPLPLKAEGKVVDILDEMLTKPPKSWPRKDAYFCMYTDIYFRACKELKRNVKSYKGIPVFHERFSLGDRITLSTFQNKADRRMMRDYQTLTDQQLIDKYLKFNP